MKILKRNENSYLMGNVQTYLMLFLYFICSIAAFSIVLTMVGLLSKVIK